MQNSIFVFKNVPKCLIQISGPESIDWFNKISSQKIDVNSVKNNIVDKLFFYSAFLTAGGECIANFSVRMDSQNIFLLMDPSYQDDCLQFLNFMHFGENLSFSNKLVSISHISFFDSNVENSLSLKLKNSNKLIAETEAYLQAKLPDLILFPGPSSHKISMEFINSQNAIDANQIIDTLKNINSVIIKDYSSSLQIFENPKDYLEYHYLLQFPLSKKDLNKNNIILEAGLDEYVSTDKGCYPGQEVVAKVYTYGRLAKYVAFLNLKQQDELQIPVSYEFQKQVDSQIMSQAQVCNYIEIENSILRSLFETTKIYVLCIKRIAFEKHQALTETLTFNNTILPAFKLKNRDLSLNK